MANVLELPLSYIKLSKYTCIDIFDFETELLR